MKKITYLLLFLSLIGCVGCGSKEKRKEVPAESLQSDKTITSDGNTSSNIDNPSKDTSTISAGTPCEQILSAPLSSGLIQIDNHLFKVDGTYTVADVMKHFEHDSENYYLFHDFGTPLSTNDYAGKLNLFEICDKRINDSIFCFQTSDNFCENDTPTIGEGVIRYFGIYDNYYCLSNGFTDGYNISEEDLQLFFQKEGLREDSPSWVQAKNTYVRDVIDGLPVYSAYVVSSDNPNAVLRYTFAYKSKDTLNYCQLYVFPASSYID